MSERRWVGRGEDHKMVPYRDSQDARLHELGRGEVVIAGKYNVNAVQASTWRNSFEV